MLLTKSLSIMVIIKFLLFTTEKSTMKLALKWGVWAPLLWVVGLGFFRRRDRQRSTILPAWISRTIPATVCRAESSLRPWSGRNGSGVTGGANDRAVSFTGKGALVADDSNAFAFDILPPFTIEVWARTSKAGQSNTAWVSYGFPDNQNQTSGGYRLGLVDGNLVFSLYGVVDINSEVEFPADGQWPAAAAYDYDQVRFFLDGGEKQAVDAEEM